jgi:hypothetical protein
LHLDWWHKGKNSAVVVTNRQLFLNVEREETLFRLMVVHAYLCVMFLNYARVYEDMLNTVTLSEQRVVTDTTVVCVACSYKPISGMNFSLLAYYTNY